MIADYNNEADKRAEEVLGKLISGGDFGAIAKEYSDDVSRDNDGDLGWITESSRPELINLAKSLKVGESTKDLVPFVDGYRLLKLEDKRIKTNAFTNEEEKEVKANHLLICYEGAERCENGISKRGCFK